MYIDDLNFSTRTRNVLKRAGIFEVSQLLAISIEELSNKKGVGPQVLDEVSAAIEKLKVDSPVETVKEPLSHSVNDRYSLVRMIYRIPNNVVIESVKFRERENAQWVDDLQITSIVRDIPPTILDGLAGLKIKTTAELAATPEEEIRKLSRVGPAAIQHLYSYFKNNVQLELVDVSERVRTEFKAINDQIDGECSVFKELPGIIESEITQNPTLLQDKEISKNIWKSPTILTYIVSCVQHQVFLLSFLTICIAGIS